MWSSSPAAAATGPARFTASAAPRTTSTAVPIPLPPLPWVCAPSGIPITVLLVSGGGLPPVADAPGGPVHGARTGALHAAAALAPRAHLDPPPAGLDGPGTAAAATAAERVHVHRPGPR